jgi:D-glycero-D-manno-heptose 1,7-bisphosphate phosphatase
VTRFAAVFLDRDGTINEKAPDGDYVRRPEELALLPGAAAALRRLNRAGIRTLLVTNQRGVARGLMTQVQVSAVNDRLAQLLAAQDARLDGVYVCPHDDGECDCRKPRPGMLLAAARDHDVPLDRSVMVGDSEADVTAGRAAGTVTVRIAPAGTPSAAVAVATDLSGAVDWILGQR